MIDNVEGMHHLARPPSDQGLQDERGRQLAGRLALSTLCAALPAQAPLALDTPRWAPTGQSRLSQAWGAAGFTPLPMPADLPRRRHSLGIQGPSVGPAPAPICTTQHSRQPVSLLRRRPRIPAQVAALAPAPTGTNLHSGHLHTSLPHRGRAWSSAHCSRRRAAPEAGQGLGSTCTRAHTFHCSRRARRGGGRVAE